mmetsp:Transcript_67498/g.187124  ORF Transcript_67498/g.187124 Transcript_67498/m.187124 type:complete len:415 (-) Transcript_67498:76-1320(-)
MAGGTTGQTAEQPKVAESKLSKMLTRIAFGVPMILLYFAIVWMGHPYIVLLVCSLQVGLFRELVNVKYQPAKEKQVPLFRTLQWSMFSLAMYFVYGKFFAASGLARSAARQLPKALAKVLQDSLRYHALLSFSGYVVVFVTFVLSLKQGLYKYQIGNAVWTIGVLALIVYQISGAAVLIFQGLFWFMLPCGLVVANDCFAYFCGVAFGRRFVKAPFLALSPNKTWEGFIGAFFCSAVWAWAYSGLISRSKWLICPQPEMEVYSSGLECEPSHIFIRQSVAIPLEDLALLRIQAKPVQIHAIVLSCFASVVAPFGGFLASAIKRAYNIKDFDSLIPGHGGVMDRMDCQFLMLLCTYVYFRTFVQELDLSEERLLDLVEVLPPAAQARLLQSLFRRFNCTDACAGACTEVCKDGRQ